MPGYDETLYYYRSISDECKFSRRNGTKIVRQWDPKLVEGCREYNDRELVGFVRDRSYNMLKRFGDFDENSGDTIILSIGARVGRWAVDFGPGSIHNRGGQLRLLNPVQYRDELTAVASLLEGLYHALRILVPLVYRHFEAHKNAVPVYVRIRTDSQEFIDLWAEGVECKDIWDDANLQDLQELTDRLDNAMGHLWSKTHVIVQLWKVDHVDVDESF